LRMEIEVKNNVDYYIEKSGLKLKFVAKELDVSMTQLRNWRSGRSFPTVPKLFKLALLLDVELTELYEVERLN
jgi:putative transcriptional regulator